MIFRPDFNIKVQMRAIQTQKKKAIMRMMKMIKMWKKNILKQKRKLALKF